METITVQPYDENRFAGVVIDQFPHPTWKWNLLVSYVANEGIRIHTQNDLLSKNKSTIGRYNPWTTGEA